MTLRGLHHSFHPTFHLCDQSLEGEGEQSLLCLGESPLRRLSNDVSYYPFPITDICQHVDDSQFVQELGGIAIRGRYHSFGGITSNPCGEQGVGAHSGANSKEAFGEPEGCTARSHDPVAG